MAAIFSVFQILWVYYGLLIVFATGGRMEFDRSVDQSPKRVSAHRHFARKENKER